MTPDLDALSREIAATSDAWMQRGVSGVAPDGRLWLWTGSAWIDDDYMPASKEECDGDEGPRWFSSEVADIWPHLADPVTVNSLLGATGNAWQDVCGGIVWMACVDNADVAVYEDRTEAICRAWIAAHKEKP